MGSSKTFAILPFLHFGPRALRLVTYLAIVFLAPSFSPLADSAPYFWFLLASYIYILQSLHIIIISLKKYYYYTICCGVRSYSGGVCAHYM